LKDEEESEILEDMKLKYHKSMELVLAKLIPTLDESLFKKGIKCLKKIITDKYKENLNLLQSEEDEFLYVNLVFGKLPFKFSYRPQAIPLTNSIYGEKYNTRVCLFVKDPRSDFKDLEIHNNLPFKLKVLDIEKLKLKYSRFQERRNLLKEYDVFLCDYKIYILLKKITR